MPIEITQVKTRGPKYVILLNSKINKPTLIYGGNPTLLPHFEDRETLIDKTIDWGKLAKQSVNPNYTPNKTAYIPVQKNPIFYITILFILAIAGRIIGKKLKSKKSIK